MAGRGCEEEEDVAEKIRGTSRLLPEAADTLYTYCSSAGLVPEQKDLHSHLRATWADQPNNAATITHWLRKSVQAGIGGTNHTDAGATDAGG